MKISDIDKNFESKSAESTSVFLNVLQKPFKIYGVHYEQNRFVRMPISIASSVSEGVAMLNNQTAGGRVRFKTDSPFVALKAKLNTPSKMPHMTTIGSCGFDLFADNRFVGSFIPPYDFVDGFESVLQVDARSVYEVTVNMPLYCGVSELYIGLAKDSSVFEADDYADIPPIVYYGSSITQGGCASRPGNCYQHIIQREINIDCINLGFSGNAKAEKQMIEYLASLKMSLFVMDYDHNAPSLEHLKNTHEQLYRGIREKHPFLPILIITKPDIHTEECLKRRDFIRSNYEKFLAEGDKNVHFIDGSSFFPERGLCTVDSIHPTDLGFYFMAEKIGDKIKQIFNLQL